MSVTQTTSGTTSEDTMASRVTALLGVMIVAGIVIIGVGSGLLGASLSNALIAWSVCTVSALLAHVGGEYPKGTHNFAARMAIQMVVRTVIPFGVALWGVKFAEPPLETSLVFYILSFYLVGTLVDVQLHVRRLKSESTEAGRMS